MLSVFFSFWAHFLPRAEFNVSVAGAFCTEFLARHALSRTIPCAWWYSRTKSCLSLLYIFILKKKKNYPSGNEVPKFVIVGNWYSTKGFEKLLWNCLEKNVELNKGIRFGNVCYFTTRSCIDGSSGKLPFIYRLLSKRICSYLYSLTNHFFFYLAVTLQKNKRIKTGSLWNIPDLSR